MLKTLNRLMNRGSTGLRPPPGCEGETGRVRMVVVVVGGGFTNSITQPHLHSHYTLSHHTVPPTHLPHCSHVRDVLERLPVEVLPSVVHPTFLQQQLQ